MRRRFLYLGLALLPVCLAAKPLLFFSLTGRFWPVRIIEELHDPVEVVGWNKAGLRLRDGRLARLPGMLELPETSEALSQATARGVELTEGRVLGLVRVHHFCGRDAVREHVARVDLAHLLRYAKQGKSEPLPFPADEDPGTCRYDEPPFDEPGWRSTDFYAFTYWSERLSKAEK